MHAFYISTGVAAAQLRSRYAIKGLVDPNEVNFTQPGVNKNVLDYAQDMKNNRWDWKRSGPVRVMEIEGTLVSYDNRRVAAARMAGVTQIPYEIVTPTDMFPGSKRTWAQQFDRRRLDPRNLVDGEPLPRIGTNDLPRINE